MLLGGLTVAGWLLASPPGWWAERGVTTNGAPNDYAAANIGQLKHIAKQASLEMEARLPGGAGPAVTALVASWSQPPAPGVVRNDYAALTQGQLKAVAKVFYDRLAAVGCTGHPLSPGQTYPWTADTSDDASFAPANIGQLKQVFSFDLYDNDSDGLPDAWERQYFNTLGYGPTDDPGNVGRTLLQSHQQGLSPWPAPTVATGLRAWYRADKGVTKDGDNKVSQWLDLSGTGAHVRQTDYAYRQPAFVAAAMNAQPAVEFGGDVNVLLTPSPIDVFAGSDNLSVVMVLKPNGNQANEMSLLAFDNAAFVAGQAYTTNRVEALWWDPVAQSYGSGGGATLVPEQAQVYVLTKSGTSLRAYLGGLLQSDDTVWWMSQAPLQQGPRTMALGGATQSVYTFKGQIAEVLIYNRVLTTAERNAIEGSLQTKYINPDADADGLPDAWEDQQVGTRAYGPTDDPGNVGRTLLQSYQQELGPWPAATVPSGVRAWYRADLGVIKGADNKVQQWTDVSGHGVHVLQTTAEKQPAWVPSVINNRPALSLGDAATALLTKRPFEVFNGSDDLTILAVLKPSADQPENSTLLDFSNVAFQLKQTSTAGQFEALWLDPTETNFANGGAATFVSGQPQVYAFTKSGVHLQSRIGGAIQTDEDIWWLTTAPLQQGGRSLTIGAMGNQLANFKGQIAELLIYNRALSNTERAQVEAALTAKYFSDPNADDDGDGLTNGQEATLGTNPNSRDTDGDGLSDSEEVGLGTDPKVADLAEIPAHISGRRVHLKADAGVTVDGNGKVSAWADQSTNANHVTQSTAANRPALQVSSINGKPALRFAGSEFLTAPITTSLQPANITMLAVYKLAAAGNYSRLFALPYRAPGSWSSPYFSWSLSPSFATSAAPYMDIGTASGAWNPIQTGAAIALGTTTLLTGSHDGSTSRVYVNGVPKNTVPLAGNLSYGTATNFHVGNDPFGEYLYGDLAEILVYDHALSADEQFLLGIYLHHKYQLPGVVVPSSPTNVNAAAISSSRVNVTWQPPTTTSPIMRYIVERKVGAGNFVKIAELTDALTYLDANVTAGATYTYRISARSYAGVSAGTESNSVTAPTGGLGFPDAGLQLWLRADAGVQADGSGQVARWQDLSGHGNDVLQPTAANQPVYQAASINGKPALRFYVNGVLRSLSGAAGAGLKPANITLFAVYKMNGNGNWPKLVALPYASSGWAAPFIAWELCAGSGGNRQPNSTTSINTTYSPNPTGTTIPLDTGTLLSATYDGSANRVYLNGVLKNTLPLGGPISYGTGTSFYVGSDPVSQSLDGDIAEIMVFDRVLSSDERQAVSRYLNGRYAYSSATSPGSPSLRADAVSSTQVSLAWSAAASAEEVTYTLERKTGTGSYAVVAQVSGISYLDTTAQAGTSYTYRVKAATLAGESGYSNEAAVTTPTNAAAVPVSGLRLWLNADLLAAGAVATWPDFSNARKDLTQGNAALQPVAVANAINGHAVVRFDDSNDSMNLDPATLAGMTAGEIFVVHKTAAALPPSGTNGNLWRLGANMSFYPDGGGSIYELFGTSDPLGGTATGVPEQAITSYHLYNVSAQNGSIMNAINGRQHLQRNTNPVVFNTLNPAIGFGGLSRDVAELIIYDHTLTAAERDAVGRYLTGKYALVAPAPVPTALTARALGSTQVSLEWQHTLTGANMRFTIERKPDTGSFSFLAEVSDVLSYIDGSATAGTAYTYRIKARTLGGESNYSNEAAVTTPSTGYSMPLTGVRLWLKADSLVAGTTATIWRDQSGLGKDLYQNTAAKRPTAVPNAINGHTVMRFDETDDLLVIDPTTLAGMTAGEVFVVHRTATALPVLANQGGNGGLWTLGGERSFYPLGPGGLQEMFGTNNPLYGNIPEQTLTTTHLYNVSAQAGSIMNAINGRLHMQRDANTVVFNTTNPALCFGGIGRDIAELIIYDRALTPSEREAVGRYLNTRYAFAPAPAAPTAFAAVSLADTQVSLTWQHVLSEVGTKFVIERKTGAGAFAAIAEVSDVLSYIDGTAAAETAYVYRIKARTLGGESAYSAEVSAATPAGGTEMPLAGIRLWLKADSLITGTVATIWRDQSGLRKDLGQTIVAKRPTVVANAVNGWPVMRFDETNDVLDVDPTTLSGMSSGEVFVVHRTATALPVLANQGGNGGLWTFGGERTFYPLSTGGLQEMFGTNDPLYGPAPDQDLTAYHVYNVSAQAGSIQSTINGRVHAQRNSNVVVFNATNPALCFGGIGRDVAELIIYDHALTAGEREAVTRYLNGKYRVSPATFDSVGNFDFDADGDGLSNAYELAHGLNPYNRDSDGDGIPDGWEVAHGLNALDPSDAGLDPDGDGYTNLQEYLAGTDPQVPIANDAGATVQLNVYQPAQR